MGLLAEYAKLMGLLTVCQTPCRSKSKSKHAKPKMRSPSHKPVRSQCRRLLNQKEWSEMVGRRNEGRSQYHVFYALVQGVTQEIDYLRKCEEEPWRVPNRRTTRVSVVGCVSEYDTQHRGTNTAARFEVVKVLWDKGVSDSWTQLLILLL